MNIAIIGASGFVGSALLKEAVQRGYTVTAVARHPEKIAANGNPHITVVGCDIFDEDKLVGVLLNHDAVLSVYNAGWTNPNIYNDYLKGSKIIQDAVKKAGVKRYLVMGGAGSLEIGPGKQLVDSPDFPGEFKDGAKAARDYLNVLRKEKDLDWTFLSPAILMHPGIDTGRTGKYRTGTDQPVFDANGVSKISVEDLVIAFLDELENGNYIQRRFTVAY